MDKSKLAFGRINYILLVVGVAIVVIGFILMSGGTSTKEMFNPEVFIFCCFCEACLGK